MTMDEGTVSIDGRSVDFANRKNLYRNVSLPLRYQGICSREIKRRTRMVLESLGISEKSRFYPSELSGGQQQRAAIARALVKDARIILADEPTGALDEPTGAEVMQIFLKLRQKDRVIIIVPHDEKVAGYCDRTVRLKDGQNM